MKAIQILGLFSSRLSGRRDLNQAAARRKSLQEDLREILQEVHAEHGRVLATRLRALVPEPACEPALVAGPLGSELEKAGSGALLAAFAERACFEHGVAADVEKRLEFGNILLGGRCFYDAPIGCGACFCFSLPAPSTWVTAAGPVLRLPCLGGGRGEGWGAGAAAT